MFLRQEMGIPFNNLICASNENNILTDFFHSGAYDMSKRRLHQTISPSIDILKSSNLERLLYHVTERNGQVVAGLMESLVKHKHFKVYLYLMFIIRLELVSDGACCKSRPDLLYVYLFDSVMPTGIVSDVDGSASWKIVDKS